MLTDNRMTRILPLMAALSIGGCSTTPETLVATPQVELVSVDLHRVSLDSQTFLLGFVVENPNHFPLPVENVSYRLKLGDHRFASGSTVSDFTIPARGNGTFSVSVDLDILNTSNQVASLLRTGIQRDVDYELSGSFAVDLPFVKPLAFENTGTISIAGGWAQN